MKETMFQINARAWVRYLIRMVINTLVISGKMWLQAMVFIFGLMEADIKGSGIKTNAMV